MADKDVQQLCDIELLQLIHKLQSRLRQDFARIYHESLFCDVELSLGKSTVYSNCCVLQARASRFFSALCSVQKAPTGCCTLDALSAESLKSFVRDLYLKDNNSATETCIVKFLLDAKESPDFEEFVTPLTSPSELSRVEKRERSLLPTSLYYPLVPVDWERELAEQDFLFASFQSILKKERRKGRRNLAKHPFHESQSSRNHLQSKSLLDLKKAIKEDFLLIQEDCNTFSPGGLSNFISSDSKNGNQVLFQCKFLCPINQTSSEEDESVSNGFFDANDYYTSILCDDVLIGENHSSPTLKSVMEHQPDMSDGVNQDRGREESRSARSASSTDCNVWDTSGALRTCSLESWVKNAPSHDDVLNADFVDLVLEELVDKSRKQTLDEHDREACQPGGIAGSSLNAKPNFFINAASLLDETEIQSSCGFAATQEIGMKEENSSGDHAFEEASSKICHVDSTSNYENQSYRESPSPDELVSSKSDHSSETVANEAADEVQPALSSAEGVSYASHSQSTIVHSVKGDSDEKPSSLIRSNTFELETEDDRLALLRQEYERRQGNMIFQRCVSQSSGPLSDGSSEHDQHQHCTSLTFNGDISQADTSNISSLPPHVIEEDVHTPDSLNNDYPDTVFASPGGDNDTRIVNESNYVKNHDALEPKSLDLNGESTRTSNSEPRGNFDSLPVVSGGLTISCREIASPLFSRRKTESAPILSGAAPPCPEVESSENKPKLLPKISMSSAWVVDISDITKSPEPCRKKKNSAPAGSVCDVQSSKSGAQATCVDSRSSTSGLGFFINLKNTENSNADSRKVFSSFCDVKDNSMRKLSDSGELIKNCRKDLQVDENVADSSGDQRRHSVGIDKVVHSPEKKLFSMFIDIGDKVPPRAKPELSSRLKQANSSSSLHKSRDSHSLNQAKFNKAEKYVWTQDNNRAPTGENVRPEQRLTAGLKNLHQRTQSLSTGKGLTGGEVGTSSLSRTSRQWSTQSLHDDDSSTDDKSPVKPMFSSFHASLPIKESMETHASKLNPPAINRHNNGSEESLCSVDTYSICTPENSITTDDFTSKGHGQRHLKYKENCETINKKSDESEKFSSKTYSKTKCNNSISEDGVGSKTASDVTFVRLSDLDREPMKLIKEVTAATVQRMSRSIPETSWIESKLLMTQSTGGRCSTMSTSSRSLSRLFPHLSASGGSLGRSKTSSSCSPATEDLDIMRSSEVSDLSSMQSSIGLDYSTESTDISSGRGSPATQLGDDLLKMFLEEINTDVTVEVGGRRIKAHKCILSSRCQYFAAILSGGWVESAGNVISLQGFSYNCVHFALCHIYSGASNIPDHISIVELATLADMLCLEGLKEVIMYTLKVKYCHFFHKPCAVCSVGVLECLPLATAYSLDDIYRKSLRWIMKYFVKIWPTKAFVALPRELIEKCYQQHIVHMTEENVLETIICCDKLTATIPNVRWTEPVFSLTSRLLESCTKYMADNFSAVLASESFLSLGKDLPWNMNRVQECLFAASDRLPPAQACQSYTRLCSVLNIVQAPNPPPEMSWHPNFVELLVMLRDRSERSLIRQAARAARTSAWGQMPLESRRKIQDAACLVLNPAEHATSRYRRSTSDGSGVSSHRSSVHSRNLDLRQLSMAMSQHARRSEHPSASTRKPNQTDRLSAPVASQCKPATAQGRPKTWPAQVKSRYLEKKPTPTQAKPAVDSSSRGKPTAALASAPVPLRRTAAPINKGLLISSSDSSRNSSPAMKRSSGVAATNSQTKTVDPRGSSTTAVTRIDLVSQSSDQGDLRTNDSRVKPSTKGKTLIKSSANLPKTPPIRRKAKAVVPVDLMGMGENESNLRRGDENITMSNDSLATHSSCDDCSIPHEGIESQEEKVQALTKHVIAKSASATYISSEKRSDLRNPLTLANKKASPFVPQKKVPFAATKPLSSPLSKRNVIQNLKTANPPGTSSRLSIPLRTSASTSSVPERNISRVGNSVDNLPSKKSGCKDLSRLQSLTNTKKIVGTVRSTNSSLAGKVSKSNKVNNNLSSSGVNSDKASVDHKSGSTGQPSVGPRSGTFLKDEPTVLKTPMVDSQQA